MRFKHSSCSTTSRWEEAGTSLVVAVKDYLELCLNLGTDSLPEDANSKDLVSRIDSTLAVAHTAISCHLNKSSSALARTRNRLASSFSRFPEEVLSEIFMHVVYGRSDTRTSGYLPMEQEIRLIYRSLYALLGVCSSWRDMVMNRSVFWSIIPIFSSSSANKWRPFGLSLQRSDESPLHLAAVTKSTDSSIEVLAVLAKHGSRFRTINISMDNIAVIREAINRLLQHNAPGSLSELSIQFSDMFDLIDGLPRDDDYIIPRNSPQHTSFLGLLGALRTFRLWGAHFHWDTVNFSNRLVELQIEEVVLGYDDAIVPFVRALASAPNLRDLKVISVGTFQRSGTTPARNPPSLPLVTLPSLQSLLLRDLYLNTLDYLLSTISRGSYHLTLFLTSSSAMINTLEAEFADHKHYDGLFGALRRTSVDMLMVDGYLYSQWLTGSMFGRLLKAMPTLKTLKMHKWDFNEGLFRNLMRTDDTQTPSEGPVLQSIHLTSALIHSEQGFRDMVASYPLRQMVLGGVFYVARHDQRPLGEESSMVQWLRENIPDLELLLVEPGYCPPEFQDFNSGSSSWPLW